MSQKSRVVLAFAAGLLAGGAIAGGFVAWHWNRNFSGWYVLQVADQANVAKEILSDRGPALAERIKTTLPAYVHAVHTEFAQAEGANWALWTVSDVYKAAGTPPPPDIAAVLAALPPRASCKKPAAPSR